MRFSVIIPLYNGAKLIERTLDSVVSQTYRDFEIVLVNDGSPDNTGEIVKKYIADHPGVNFKYIEQKNKGLGGARNTALKNASGEIICLLDQDDVWYREKLYKVEEEFRKDPGADIVSHAIRIAGVGKQERVFRTGPGVRDMFRALLFGGNCLRTPSVSFKKDLVDKVGLFSEDRKLLHLVEDYDMWLRMAKSGAKFIFIDDILAEYNWHEANYSMATVGSLKNMIAGEEAVVRLHYRALPRKTPSDWYNIRRRIGKINYSASQKACSLYGDLFTGAGYLIKGILMNPLYFIEYLLKRRGK